MNLHDSTIAHIAKLVQMAIITGTDITDHLRMMHLVLAEDSKLVLEEKYQEVFDVSLTKLIENSKQNSDPK